MDLTTRIMPKPSPKLHGYVEKTLWCASLYSDVKFGYHTMKYPSVYYRRYLQGTAQ